MQMVGLEKMLLRNLESSESDDGTKIKIKAELFSMEKSDMIIERIIGVVGL